MSKMKELYEKVAADSTLQAKFSEIMKDAEVDGEAETKEKLVAFAKENGYDVTLDEMQDFFKGLAESKEGELSDAELDLVAGGKTQGEIIVSTLSLGIGCAVASIIASTQNTSCSDEINHALNKEV